MRLHDEWAAILKNAWSVRLMALSAVLGGISAALPVAQPYLNANPLWIACAVGVATTGSALAGIAARIVRQDSFDGPTAD